MQENKTDVYRIEMRDIVEWCYNEAPQEWTPQSYWINYGNIR